ncbi:MAG: hypothetical protein HC781_03660 [Leptolyngbyaceae cyanobacterium CSU_1_4]|nr:hypothetical protein [Leptolyngbyaceae cyanobacterium CSU_1_4]
MDDQNIRLARLGNTEAIAHLIQKAILTEAVSVKVLRQNNHLQVFLSSPLPDRQLALIVYAALVGLGSPQIRSLQVAGQQGQEVVWTQQFVLEDGSFASALKKPLQNKPRLIPVASASKLSFCNRSSCCHATPKLCCFCCRS